MMSEKDLREKYRFSALELGQAIRGVDSLRRSEGRSPDFWDDVAAYFAKRFPGSAEERSAKQGWFVDIMKFIQRKGQNLIEADYIRSDEGTVAVHEDLLEALVGAGLLDEPDEDGSFLDQDSVLKGLDSV